MRWLVRAAVSAIVAAILFRFIPLGAVVDALTRIDPWTWVASLAIFFGGHYLNAVKLDLLIGRGTVPLSACVRAQYAGLIANLGLPGLAGGDLVRAAYLAPAAGTARIALASIADRLIDTATLVVLILTALPFAGVPPALRDIFARVRAWLPGVIGSLVLLVLVLAFVGRRSSMARKAGEAWTGLRARRAGIAVAVVISLMVQSSFVLTNVWLARRVGVTTDLAPWFVAWPLSKLIAVLPISLGGIGVREAALVSLLAPYGGSKEAVLASGILWQAVLAVSGFGGLFVTHVLLKSTQPRAVVKSSGGKV